jgi:hypothetical protein
MAKRIYEGTVTVCCHEVSFYYNLPPRKRVTDEIQANMTEEAEERAKTCIIDNCNQGELNYETENFQATGWWRIKGTGCELL